jgi:two-component system, sensor histidine kinase PhcS
MFLQNLQMDDKLFREKYRKEIFDFRAKFSKVGCAISAVLIFGGTFLDFAFYPEFYFKYLTVRIICSIITFCVFYLLSNKKLQNYVAELTIFWLLIPQVMISYFIYDSNGYISGYVFGLSLAIFASSIIVPVHSVEGLFFGATTFFMYAIACILNPNFNFLSMPFYGNLLFLIFSILISSVCTFFNEESRVELFTIQNENAEKNTLLQQVNRELTDIKAFAIDQEKMSALGTMSAGLLHEVNNPINYSLMAIEMALMDPDVKKGSLLHESLVDSKEGMNRIQKIVSDLKTFAYQKPGQNTKRLFLFENAVNSAMRLTGYETKGIHIQLDLPLDTHVLGDEPALIGVMINLISNASMAILKVQPAQPLIHIKVWHENSRLHVSVRDNGSGIDPKNIAKVFEPFFTTRDVGKGLGLGLAVCYAVVNRHDSLLKVSSVLGLWTEFTFDLEVTAQASAP